VSRARLTGIRGILFTDMVGSSQLRSRLGDDRADDLRRAHDALIGADVAAHGGTVLRWTGDGVKAAFPSASAAVAAALDIQRAVARYSLSADAVAPFQIRIGISVGEVVEEDDDVHGVAVIEGARLEAMAGPGEILVTDLVPRLGQRRLDVEFEEVGSHSLKGLDQPVSVLRVIDNSVARDVRPIPRAVVLDERFPLVGRDSDMEVALRTWRDVQTGSAHTVLVAGQPGIGKSRFIAQLVARAHAAGALVLAGVCDSDLAVPYQPFAAAFGDAPATDEELALALESGAGPLGPLFPTRRSGRFEDGGPSARFELFEAVAGLVARLAHDQPLVIALEDLQWATPPTVQLLRHLVRNVTRTRVLLLASYRIDDVGVGHPLQELFAEAHGAKTVTRIELDALSLEDVRTLVSGRAAGAAADGIDRFARRVFEESSGSPFFVCELLEHLSATGELEVLVGHSARGDLPIPDSVRDVVGQRLGRLPPGAVDLLGHAAVIGLTFDLELLAGLAGQTPEHVLGTLEAVGRTALVNEIDAGRFSFAHAIVRTTLLERMSATRRALAHRRVAEAIDALGRSDHDVLAHHWQLAGVEEKAYVHLELAARRDLDALAYESAAERYRAVLDRQGRLPVSDPATLARAWLGFGLAGRALGQADFVAAIEEAGRIGRRLRDADVVAEAAIASVWPGTFFVTAGRTRPSLVELGEDALELVDAGDPRRARILATLAAHLTFDTDRERRVRLLAEALELARKAGDPEVVGSVLVAEFIALWDPTTFERRAAIAAEAGRMARASGNGDLEFFAGFFSAIGAAERCDVALARRHLDALAGPVAASKNFYFAFLAERFGVSLDLLAGRPEVQAAIDALARRYADTHADTSGTWSLQTGGVALQAGALGAFEPALRAMVEKSDVAANWKPPYGLALLATGRREEALKVLEGFEEPPLDYFWLTTLQTLAELAIGLDHREVAARLFDRLYPHRDRLGITASGTLCLGLVATTLGGLALSVGDPAAASDLLDAAVGRADAMDAPFERVKSRRLLAQALVARGIRHDDVFDLLATATELAGHHGFRGEREAIATLTRDSLGDLRAQ
jgi:class 3 adenylate cyclase/tetratricopeptide (TPR) repeat protein